MSINSCWQYSDLKKSLEMIATVLLDCEIQSLMFSSIRSLQVKRKEQIETKHIWLLLKPSYLPGHKFVVMSSNFELSLMITTGKSVFDFLHDVTVSLIEGKEGIERFLLGEKKKKKS